MLHNVGSLLVILSSQILNATVNSSLEGSLSSYASCRVYITAVRHSQARWVTIPSDMPSYVRLYSLVVTVTVDVIDITLL